MLPPLSTLPPPAVLFRDNLAEVLAGAVPGERQMEAKLRQWLQRCHATLDKSVRFEALADARTQVGSPCLAAGEGRAIEPPRPFCLASRRTLPLLALH